MKIGSPLDGKKLSSPLSSIFERCSYFVILDSDHRNKVTIFPNNAQTAARGAEIQAAQLFTEQNIDILITHSISSNALDILLKAGIRVYLAIDGSFRENIEAYLQGRLVETFMAFPHTEQELESGIFPISTFQNN